MAEADARAAAHIFWARNPSSGTNGSKGGIRPVLCGCQIVGCPILFFLCSAFLDLHGLHVKEACSLVSTVIKQRADSSIAKRGSLVICAGVGKHSNRSAADGSGRLASAVERLLARSGLEWKQLQPGLYSLQA